MTRALGNVGISVAVELNLQLQKPEHPTVFRQQGTRDSLYL